MQGTVICFDNKPINVRKYKLGMNVAVGHIRGKLLAITNAGKSCIEFSFKLENTVVTAFALPAIHGWWGEYEYLCIFFFFFITIFIKRMTCFFCFILKLKNQKVKLIAEKRLDKIILSTYVRWPRTIVLNQWSVFILRVPRGLP